MDKERQREQITMTGHAGVINTCHGEKVTRGGKVEVGRNCSPMAAASDLSSLFPLTSLFSIPELSGKATELIVHNLVFRQDLYFFLGVV